MLIKRIFSTLRADAKGIILDKGVFFLTIIYGLIFGYNIFIMNDINISLLGTYSVDHASMLDSLIKMLQGRTFYNQMAGYHSSYYGWTYFFFSFWFLLPVKFIVMITGINSYLPTYIGLKILHFAYGLLAILSFYYLAKKFVSPYMAVIGGFMLMLTSPLMSYLSIFHPESVGVLFLNLACIQLYYFRNRADKETYYYITLLFLVLSTLAKPTFFLMALALYICLLGFYTLNKPRFTKEFAKLIGKTAAFSLGVFVIVNPFFFIQLDKAIIRQIDNVTAQTQSPLGVQTASEAAGIWLTIISQDPFLLFSIVASILMMIGLFCTRKAAPDRRYYATFLCVALMICTFIITKFRLFFVTEYFIPVLPFLTLSAIGIVSYALHRLRMSDRITHGFTTIFFLIILAPNFCAGATRLEAFYLYKETTQYRIYDYINKNVAQGSSIVHDESVGIPSDKDIKDFHYWQHSMDDLRNAHADYVIYNPKLVYNNQKRSEQTEVLESIVQKNHYKKLETIDGVEIWKKK